MSVPGDSFQEAVCACASASQPLFSHVPPVVVRMLGRVEYAETWQAMREFTASRDPASADELWVLEHPPVYTLGQAGRPEHLLSASNIPVVNCDRGGQITYHGPGQVVVYVLVDLRRRGYGIRDLVHRMEEAVIELLADFGIAGDRRSGAPGVYVGGAKIAALGLRVKHGCTYHGVALNADGDLAPFSRINPCGYPGLSVTRLLDHGVEMGTAQAGALLARKLEEALINMGEDAAR